MAPSAGTAAVSLKRHPAGITHQAAPLRISGVAKTDFLRPYTSYNCAHVLTCSTRYSDTQHSPGASFYLPALGIILLYDFCLSNTAVRALPFSRCCTHAPGPHSSLVFVLTRSDIAGGRFLSGCTLIHVLHGCREAM